MDKDSIKRCVDEIGDLLPESWETTNFRAEWSLLFAEYNQSHGFKKNKILWIHDKDSYPAVLKWSKNQI